ncbi:MAG: hypothetical protein U1E65_11805 [Myxococcota bacterium]
MRAIWAAILALACALPRGAAAEGERPRRAALSLGFNRARDPAWPLIRFGDKDAADVGERLRAIGFDSVRVLSAPEETTRSALAQAIAGLDAAAPGPDDVVVVYLSVPGTLTLDAEGALRRILVLADTRPDALTTTGLLVDALVARLDQLRARHRVLVLATSYSAGTKALPQPPLLRGGRQAIGLANGATLVLSAADVAEGAEEDGALGNDVYTHYLLEALSAAVDLDEDGNTTALEAHEYARARTSTFTEGRQHPRLEGDLEARRPAILRAGLGTEAGRWEISGYAPEIDGLELWLDDRVLGTFPGTFALAEGARVLELRRAGSVVRRALSGGPPQHLDAEAILEDGSASMPLTIQGGVTSVLGASGELGSTSALRTLGVSVRWWDVPLLGFELGADLAFSLEGSNPPLGSEAAGLTLVGLSSGLHLGAALELGALRLVAGPRLGLVLIARAGTPSLGALVGPELGFLGAAELSLGRLFFLLEGRAGLLPLIGGSSVRTTAVLGLALGLGVRL